MITYKGFDYYLVKFANDEIFVSLPNSTAKPNWKKRYGGWSEYKVLAPELLSDPSKRPWDNSRMVGWRFPSTLTADECKLLEGRPGDFWFGFVPKDDSFHYNWGRYSCGPYESREQAMRVCRDHINKMVGLMMEKKLAKEEFVKKRYDCRVERMNKIGDSARDVISEWHNGDYVNLGYFRHIGKSDRQYWLSPKGLENPNVEPIAVWEMKKRAHMRPLLIYTGNNYYMYGWNGDSKFGHTDLRISREFMSDVSHIVKDIADE